jgi:hypothetical protein
VRSVESDAPPTRASEEEVHLASADHRGWHTELTIDFPAQVASADHADMEFHAPQYICATWRLD